MRHSFPSSFKPHFTLDVFLFFPPFIRSIIFACLLTCSYLLPSCIFFLTPFYYFSFIPTFFPFFPHSLISSFAFFLFIFFQLFLFVPSYVPLCLPCFILPCLPFVPPVFLTSCISLSLHCFWFSLQFCALCFLSPSKKVHMTIFDFFFRVCHRDSFTRSRLLFSALLLVHTVLPPFLSCFSRPPTCCLPPTFCSTARESLSLLFYLMEKVSMSVVALLF